MNQNDSPGTRIDWISRRIGSPVDFHFARIGLHQTCQQIHQGALAGAVLTNQGVHFAFLQM